MIDFGNPAINAFFVSPSGKSYGRLEDEKLMPKIMKEVPLDIDSFLYVGKGGDEGLPSFYAPWAKVIKTLDINPIYAPDIVADIRDTKLPAESFDAITLPAVLEHVFEKDQVVAECHRLLRPQGIFIVSVPWVFPYHNDDGCGDYWRISPDGLEKMLEPLFDNINVTSTWWSTYGWATK